MQTSSSNTLRDDAFAIWRAGVEAVRPGPLMKGFVSCTTSELRLGERSFSIESLGRVLVVGGGKAGAEMAEAFEQQLSEAVLAKVSGWLNVPSDCVKQLQKIHLHPARPAGVNRPTSAGVKGTREIISRMQMLTEKDVCLVLLSGGGSALITQPPAGITVSQKLALIDQLESAGADIAELNAVRKKLSLVKGGRLASLCTACPLVSLIISDVIGDPLDVIASGPTVEDTTSVDDAIEILHRRCGSSAPEWAMQYLRSRLDEPAVQIPEHVSNVVIGSNARAIAAATKEAERLGYFVHSMGSENSGNASTHARELLVQLRKSSSSGPRCVLSGGEPTVELAPMRERGKGGRNQQLALAAVAELLTEESLTDFALLSAGTDGEDGPTDAAGAVVDRSLVERVREEELDVEDFLKRNDAYTFFSQVGTLIKTGATNTNVMDLRVALSK